MDWKRKKEIGKHDLSSGYMEWVSRDIIESLSNEDGNGQRERYKTIHLITEYNDLTWEYNHLATFPSSSSETAREKLDSGVLQRTRS